MESSEQSLSITECKDGDLTTLGPLELLILQPTSFCNIACDYCYLPDRQLVNQMSLDTFSKIMKNIFSSNVLGSKLTILWHAGEPLAIPINFYKQVSKEIKRFSPQNCQVTQSIQTNATIINDDWCKFFKDESIILGLSIDGPDFIHDRHRKTRAGGNTHAKVMEGVKLLKKYEIKFNVICVLTSFSLGYPDEIYDFFEKNDIRQVGFNIEESEGINTSDTLSSSEIRRKFRYFMERIYKREKEGHVQIREFHKLRQYFTHSLQKASDQRIGRCDIDTRSYSVSRPLNIITVSSDGDASTFSPELLGMFSPEYPTLKFGNLTTDSIETIANSELFKKIFSDVTEGIAMCKKECDYFTMCGGGAPSNKLSENGTFRSTFTKYCKTQLQVPIDILLEDLEQEFGLTNKSK